MIWIARHLAWSSFGVCALLLMLGYAFVFRGQIAELQRADRIAQLNEERGGKEAYLKQLDALAKEYDGFAIEDVERARTMIPSEDDIPGILAMLEAASSNSDVLISAVNFAAADTTGIDVKNVGALSISISLQHGNYERFKLFLRALQDNLRLFDVRSASINPSAASYTLTLRAYVWKKAI
jgi:Tfp pilus assembly protein PilO